MAGFTTVEVQTRGSQDIVDITSEIRKVVRESGVSDGICVVFSMHTTAGITINENADPDVKTDRSRKGRTTGTLRGTPTPICAPHAWGRRRPS